ncbi:5-oxoprolinase subunit PxpB [Maribacter sp. 2307ULW6-5]|uniref:5-oxoprolinase subunit PxpB n=1 Tax=Maribacter sp. 2307ULW6-5 TaxID=3386275 RepID=UPI0039BC5DD2
MSHFSINIKPFGRHAIQVEWPNEVQESILTDILQFESHLKKHFLSTPDWETVPAYNSLMLVHRDAPVEFNAWEERLRKAYADRTALAKVERTLWKIPVCYGDAFALDLEAVAHSLNMTPQELVAQHSGRTYTVYGIGFLPGFMYLGGLPSSLELPRRSEPRPKVPKGAVGLAGKQTGIYPQESPGGWHIIGRTFVPLFDASRKEPCFVSVGDKVQFTPISKSAFELHAIEVEVGIYNMQKSVWDD